MSASIITISREFGSGGHTIGKMVADSLEYDFYDWNIVEKIAQETGFATNFIEEHSEEQNRFAAMLAPGTFGFTLSDQLFEAQSQVIFELAQKGKCVIVGRCADYLLRNDPNVLSCFVFANEKQRRERVLQEYGENDIPIERRIKEKDKRRKAHYEYFTSRKWGKAFYFDLCIDTASFSLGQAAQLIILAAQNFEPHQRHTGED